MVRTFFATIALGFMAVPAGQADALNIRVVTIGDETGPAFYSPIEGGYRFIAVPPSKHHSKAPSGNRMKESGEMGPSPADA